MKSGLLIIYSCDYHKHTNLS